MKAYKVNRLVSKEECPHLEVDVQPGTIVHHCRKATYGCIGEGFAATLDPNGGYPFFELPWDAVNVVLI